MSKYIKNIICILSIVTLSSALFAQDEDFFLENYLKEEVVVENPVYMPVVGVGGVIMNFHGDVTNNTYTPLIGQMGVKVNIATYIEKTHSVRLNFSFLTGSLSATHRDLEQAHKNQNFQTEINTFGVNFLYNFKNLYEKERKIMPWVAAGAGVTLFDPKGDLFYKTTTGEELEYHYWSDGTIRFIPENLSGELPSAPRSRDYIYETSYNELDRFDNVDDSQYTSNMTVIFPLDAGFDFKISERVFIRLGYSYNFTLNDYLDDIGGTENYITNAQGNQVNVGGDESNDHYSYFYTSLHLDLFSEAKTIIQERLFAEFESDPTLLDDDDVDFILDIYDECLDTPIGVEVDSVGCPYDDDNDGVPNYLDQEKNSPESAIVDEFGVSLSTEELISELRTDEAVDRSEVDLYIMNYSQFNRNRFEDVEVPDKFKSVDYDQDGYISFDEVLDAIDNFFDYKSGLSTEDIYELNEFFFQQ